MKNKLIGLVACYLQLFTVANAQTPGVLSRRLPPGTKVERDIEYSHIDGVSLKLDIYSPEQPIEHSAPLVVWIHGGAWLGGDKQACPAVRLVKRGYIVASVNYRLSQKAIYPAQIQDCKTAIRWLRAHAEEYHIDAARIGAWGSSAGGHLVALLGTSGGVDELNPSTLKHRQLSDRVQAVCDFFGPTDFLQMDKHALASAPFKHDAPDSPESKLIGAAIQENPDLVARANPIFYVSSDDPPFLIMHGDQDPLVPFHQSELLAQALSAVGVDNQFQLVKGYGHGLSGNNEVDAQVDEFFDRILKPSLR
ncbi:MAG: alpha/beta hydrolase [Planctomycetales bacterium]|nr:alpha/beta hydrolase [Planctomycetales bacterium]